MNGQAVVGYPPIGSTQPLPSDTGVRSEIQDTGRVESKAGGGTGLHGIWPDSGNGFLLPLHGEDYDEDLQ